uniref:Uncharacterized protein n=1 Tax=Arundo donax TaxID=35708 RepID=A0A0A9AAE6_ARUDO
MVLLPHRLPHDWNLPNWLSCQQ